MLNRKILLFETRTGNCPVQDFIKTLRPKEQQKVVWSMKLLEDGFPLKEPYFKKITNSKKMWEMRVTFGGNTFRFFFFESKNATVIFTSGFQKKSQKTPKSEIELAEKYMKEFLEENI